MVLTWIVGAANMITVITVYVSLVVDASSFTLPIVTTPICCLYQTDHCQQQKDRTVYPRHHYWYIGLIMWYDVLFTDNNSNSDGRRFNSMSSHQLHSDTELTIAVALICEKDDSMHNAIHKFFCQIDLLMNFKLLNVISQINRPRTENDFLPRTKWYRIKERTFKNDQI